MAKRIRSLNPKKLREKFRKNILVAACECQCKEAGDGEHECAAVEARIKLEEYCQRNKKLFDRLTSHK